MRLKREARSAPAPETIWCRRVRAAYRFLGPIGIHEQGGRELASHKHAVESNYGATSQLCGTRLCRKRPTEVRPGTENREEELRRAHSETLKLKLDMLRSNGLEVQKEVNKEGVKLLHYPDKTRLIELSLPSPTLLFLFRRPQHHHRVLMSLARARSCHTRDHASRDHTGSEDGKEARSCKCPWRGSSPLLVLFSIELGRLRSRPH